MTWAQRLKRVFSIDIKTCRECGGTVKVMPKALAELAGQALACIEDPVVIQKILAHREQMPSPAGESHRLPESRGPPQLALFE